MSTLLRRTALTDTKTARRAHFLAIEGCDGAGKSTAAKLLCERLQRSGVANALVYPKNPRFDDPALDALSRSLLGALRAPRHLLTSVQWVSLTAVWYQLVNKHIVQPALATNKIVIADSWYVKPMARLCLLGQGAMEECRRHFHELEQPDMTVLLDVEPAAAAARKREFGFGETGNFEKPQEMNRENFVAYQSRIREQLLALAETNRWVTIETDAAAPEQVAWRILQAMETYGWLPEQFES